MDPVDARPPAGLPPGYPVAYETDVVLTDGATAHVRPIRPDDVERLLAFHARQSPQSIYYRYFSPRPRLSEKDLDHLTTVDYVDRMALIALRGEELIGVARYDRWRHRAEAEVAFFVDDANHGRGLATVLLEHLAVRAREIGLTAFTASVLPENRKMIGVFTQAGFETATKFADGVIEVRLGLSPTPEAEAKIEERARTAASVAVRRLLSPRSVAVIGASREKGTISRDLLRNLYDAGFEGPIYPVNPNAHHVGGVRAVSSILDIHDEVDLAIVVVPAPAVPQVIEECGRKQVYGAIVLSAGFAEQGDEGAALEAEVLRVARSWGIRIVGPNCLGVINTDPAVRLHATFAQVVPRRGRVSLLSESGMVGAAIIARAREVGVGISSFVALGNRADVSVNDMLQYWAGDDHTDVVSLYIESFGNARHFSRLARDLTRLKPVVAVKTGLHPGVEGFEGLGDDTDEVLLRQTGVIQAPTLNSLLATVLLLTSQPLPRGRRVAVLGNAGGSLAIAADAALLAGLEVAELSEVTKAGLGALADRPVGLANPVDLGLHAGSTQFEEAARLLVTDPGVDSVLVLYAPSLGATPDEAHVALEAAAKADPEVTMAACFYGGSPAHREVSEGHQVPIYDAIDIAARSLGRVADYAEWLAQPEGQPAALTPDDAATAREAVTAVLARGDRHVPLQDGLGLLRSLGLATVESAVVSTLDEAVVAADAIGYPVVLKAAGREQTAKTVASGLALDLADAAALRAAWTRMADHFADALLPALVQTMVEPGIDVAIRVSDHEQVGPVMSLCAGGAAAVFEPEDDVRVLPLGDLEVGRFVAGSRLGPFLDAESRRVLEALLLRLAALVEDVPEISMLRLNPVIVGREAAVIADVMIEVSPVELDPVPPLRRVEPAPSGWR
jgi:acyl-CoA synthetase (NDP forming)/RimJ/RimL family protein N-acetyltransferase